MVYAARSIEPDVKDKEGASDVYGLHGEIEYRYLTFDYDERSRVLKDINLKIKQGETVAFVGPSGAVKSTICSL